MDYKYQIVGFFGLMPGLTSIENGKLGGRPKGAKNAATINREKLRDHFHEYFGLRWSELMEKQLKSALKDFKPRQYVFDQIIGKPRETLEMNADIILKLDV